MITVSSDPLASAGATLATAAAAVPALTAFGVNLGLRPDVLVAGFAGALVAIVLLGTVPPEGDTWVQLLRTTLRRVFVAVASSLTAGYLTPLALLLANLPDALLLGVAFAVGGGAQRVLLAAIARLSPPAAPPGGDGHGGHGGSAPGGGDIRVDERAGQKARASRLGGRS
jgi:hypothetical protein